MIKLMQSYRLYYNNVKGLRMELRRCASYQTGLWEFQLSPQLPLGTRVLHHVARKKGKGYR